MKEQWFVIVKDNKYTVGFSLAPFEEFCKDPQLYASYFLIDMYNVELWRLRKFFIDDDNYILSGKKYKYINNSHIINNNIFGNNLINMEAEEIWEIIRNPNKKRLTLKNSKIT